MHRQGHVLGASEPNRIAYAPQRRREASDVLLGVVDIGHQPETGAPALDGRVSEDGHEVSRVVSTLAHLLRIALSTDPGSGDVARQT